MDKISLKLLVNKEENRVAFAESSTDFVDILFSFLTLPMGTIIRLLGKKSDVGCMDKLYESVQNLHENCLETEACRTMLLQPRSDSELLCENLILNPNDLMPRRVYGCPTFNCFSKHKIFTAVRGARCRCGKAMDKDFELARKEVDRGQEGVFLKGGLRLIISDDLHVMTQSMVATISLLQKLGIKDVETLETRIVNISSDEILSLLRRFLLSTTPLTDVFLRNSEDLNCDSADEQLELIDPTQIKSVGSDLDADTKKIYMHLFESASSNEVMFAEAGKGLVDTLFSFLTFPLGAIVKLLHKRSSITCANNLYESVEVLISLHDYMKSEESKNKLLAPKLSPYFGNSNQPLEIEENQPLSTMIRGCETCWKEAVPVLLDGISQCKHFGARYLTQINPKLPNSGTEYGGEYVKKSVRFMVSREMTVTLSEIDVIKELKVPINTLVEREVVLGEAEVVKLLKACLISPAALSDLFSHKKLTKHVDPEPEDKSIQSGQAAKTDRNRHAPTFLISCIQGLRFGS